MIRDPSAPAQAAALAAAGLAWLSLAAPSRGQELEGRPPLTARELGYLKARAGEEVRGAIEWEGGEVPYFVPDEARELRLPFARGSGEGRLAAGVPVILRLSEAAESQPGEKGIALPKLAGAVPLVLRETAARLGRLPEDKYAPVRDALRALLRATRDESDGRKLLPPTEGAIASLCSAFVAGDRRGEEAGHLVALYRAVARQRRGLKAQYGPDDTYVPETYRRMFENTRGSVALAPRGREKAIGSGVLVGHDLVLTCLHVVERHLAEPLMEQPRFPLPVVGLEARFNYEEDLAGERARPVDVYGVTRVLAIGSPLDAGGSRLDYALLEVAPGEHGPPGRAGAWPIQTLWNFDVRRDDAVYVVGYPQGRPRAVHDHARVFFPFRVTRAGRDELLVALASELEREPLELRDQALKELEQSYRPARRDGPHAGLFENYSRRWDDQPTIGADCDTYHGNSGSPAYDRRRHWVIGLLFAGEADEAVPYRPGWRAHEAILPVPAILADLDRVFPAWRTRGAQVQ